MNPISSSASRSAPQAAYQHQEWLRGYESQPQDYDYWIDAIAGQIPPQLTGTLFRNGPGLLDIHGTPIRHPFDGDGLINAISFTPGGRVHFRSRFVRTEGYIAEQKAKKPLYRGVFGTQKPGGWWHNAFDLRLKNIANTQVIYWGGKLLALWEAAEPHRLDPQTLETLGLDYLEGLLQPGDSFAAHPWVDPSSALDNGQPCLVNFALKTGLSSRLNLFEFAPDGQLLRQHAHSIPGFAFIHDFAITPHYAIFFQSSTAFNPIPFLLGVKGAGESLQVHCDRPTKIIVIPRKPPYDRVQILEIQAGFVFHHGNAFEIENEIIIDSICYDSLPQVPSDRSYKEVDFASLNPGQLWRFRLDLAAKTVQRKLINSRSCEFPTLNPQIVGRPYRYLYLGATDSASGNAPLQAIQKVDLETGREQLYSFAPSGYVGEPIFVPDPDCTATAEDGGWLLVLVYNGALHRSAVAILDARNLEQGPVATLALKHHIPYGLHGSWTDQCFI
jgi:all-trans-8'-apo-beta-carotenal 15,15'-oxygenase